MANEVSLDHPIAGTGHPTTAFQPVLSAYSRDGATPRRHLLSQAEADAGQDAADTKMWMWVAGALALGLLAGRMWR